MKLAHIHSNKFHWYEVDVDEEEEIASVCNIRVAPTFQFYRNGTLVSELTEPNRIKLNDYLRKVRSGSKRGRKCVVSGGRSEGGGMGCVIRETEEDGSVRDCAVIENEWTPQTSV